MRSILYIVAVIFVILWALGQFGHIFGDAGGIIHILLVIAVIALILGLIRRA